MGTASRSIPANWNDDIDTGKLHQWLRGKGIDIDHGGVTTSRQNNTITVNAAANTEAEILAAAADFVPTGNAILAKLEADIAAGKPIIKAAMQKPIASRTNQELALAAIGASLWQDELLG